MASIPSPIRKWISQFVDAVRGESDGLAELTSSGVLKSSQVPDLAITETYTVEDEAERLDLDPEEGDVAIQSDNDTTYIFTGGDPTTDDNWSVFQFDVPVDAVFGRTGDVTGESGDYSYSQIDGEHDNDAHSVAYTDFDADDAVDTIESTELDILDADISGDAATVDGYEIQVDGSDGDGIINFKTE